MAEALTGSINVRLAAILTNALDLTVPKDELDYKFQWPIANGTGADQADRLWHDTRTLAASATEDLDVVGSLTDAFGATFSPARIKLLAVIAAAGNTNNVIIGGASATQFVAGFGNANDVWSVQPGDIFLATARGATAWACAGGSTDKLKIANSAGSTSVTYTIIIVAASA